MTRRNKRLLSLIVAVLAVLLSFVGQHLGWFEEPTQKIEQQNPGLYSVTRFSDGDTITVDMNGQKETIRMIGVDTPETHGPRCSAEGALGMRATQRLLALLNAGTFSLVPVKRERDRYGRTLRIVTRQGQSIGALLVAEGLARPWTGARQPWCRS